MCTVSSVTRVQTGPQFHNEKDGNNGSLLSRCSALCSRGNEEVRRENGLKDLAQQDMVYRESKIALKRILAIHFTPALHCH